MTKEEINKRIAEAVMGWRLERTAARRNNALYETCGWFDGNSDLQNLQDDWNPAECIDHAWMVVEKFLFVTLNGSPGRYTCRLISQYDDMGNGMWGTATTDTAPMAICLAALEAVKEGG